jgi:hypothetical protein
MCVVLWHRSLPPFVSCAKGKKKKEREEKRGMHA